MFPWRRRRKDFFDDDDFFGMDEEFSRIMGHMNRIFEDIGKSPMRKSGEFGPFIYGFSMKTGPDGKPIINEFGNVPAAKGGGSVGEASDEREPLTDVIEGDDDVTVIVELPGVEKEDINLEAGEESLSIKVDTDKRKYSKTLELPCKVKTEPVKATYKNGILEVKLPRDERKKDEKKKSVRIE